MFESIKFMYEGHRLSRYLLLPLFIITTLSSDDVLGQNKSGVSPTIISLPKGPGSIEGLGESFEPLLGTGMAAFTIPIDVPHGTNNHQPELKLLYNSGFGNSEFGIGWKLNIQFVQRQTDKGLPKYKDEGNDNDTFIYSDNEELVPIGDNVFRSKNEGSFLRLTRVGKHWQADLKDGRHLFFGETEDSRIENPSGIFLWLLDKSMDNNGNVITHKYIQEDGRAYLAEIRYSISGNAFHSVIYRYESREDSFSDYRSRYKVSTTKRCHSIECYSQGELVYRYDLEYSDDNTFSLLSSISKIGADGITSLPHLSFRYTQFAPQAQHAVNMEFPPFRRLSNPKVELIDLNGDALPDLINTEPGMHTLFRNIGRGRWNGSELQMLDPQTGKPNSPSLSLESDQTIFADCNSDGFADLMFKPPLSSSSPFYFYTSRGRDFWENRIEFTNNPPFEFSNSNVRLLDLNNDKNIDVFRTTNADFSQCWINLGDGTWTSTLRLPPIDDREAVRFEFPRVKLGDMNGDRMLDIVTVRSGSIKYYANKGYGEFDTPITMTNPPEVDLTFQDKLTLADINADGLDDLILIIFDVVRYWINLGNNSWSDEKKIIGTPPLSSNVTMRITDMNGNGTLDILWNDGTDGTYKYLDFSENTQRPNLLREINNGMGKVTQIEYRSSTDYYCDAIDSGRPWNTRLPFPVIVVSKVITHDENSGDDYVTEFNYRDGVYDGVEKEFRGFELVTKIEHGDETAATTVTKIKFDSGRTEESMKGKILEQNVQSNEGVLFTKEVNEYETKLLAAGTDGKAVKYSFNKLKNTFLFEGTASPKQLQEVFDIDEFGNEIKKFDYGEIVGEDRAFGNDELFTFTEYAINKEKWITDRVSRIYQTDENGNFVSEKRNYYDGPDYVGLPSGQVEKGNLTRREASLGPRLGGRFIQTVRNKYDEFGNVVGTKDANGNLREVVYDSIFHAFPTNEIVHTYSPTYPQFAGTTLQAQAQYHFGFGEVTKFTDFNGHTTEFTYDLLGRLESIIKPGDTSALPTSKFVYSLGSPISSILTQNREKSGEPETFNSITYFDGLGRAVQTKEEANGKFVLRDGKTFNLRMKEKAQFQPYFTSTFNYEPPDTTKPKTVLHYDPLGRNIKTVNPDSSMTSTIYLPLKQIIYDEGDNDSTLSHFNTPKTLYFDGLDRLTRVEELNKEKDGVLRTYTTSYEYDLLDNLTKITDNQGNVKSMLYDAVGRMLEMQDPDRGMLSYTYDDAGNIKMTEDAKGQIIIRSYDGDNRLKLESHTTRERFQRDPNDLTVAVGFNYDNDITAPFHDDSSNTLGKIASITDLSGTQLFAYDERGNIITQVKKLGRDIRMNGKVYRDLAFKSKFAYDAMDRITSRTYPDGMQVNFVFGDRSLIRSIPNFVTDAEYEPSTKKASILFSNGVQSKYSYDNRLRLKSIFSQSPKDSTVLQDLLYTYDGFSNALSIKDKRTNVKPELNSTQDFGYDDLYRLTKGVGTYGTIEHDYDSIGNMVSETSTNSDPDINLGKMTYGVNAGPHALTHAGNYDFTYDANGNLASKNTTKYEFDYKDRLSLVTSPDGQTISYTYDNNDIKVLKSIKRGNETDDQVFIDKFTELRNGQLIKYIFSGNQRVAKITTKFKPDSSGGQVDSTDTNLDRNGDGVITVEEIAAGGSNPNIIELDEIDRALEIFFASLGERSPSISFAVISEALENYFKNKIVGSNIVFYHPDHLGSNQGLTNSEGKLVQELSYLPFGKIRQDQKTGESDYQFTDKEYDNDTGLNYFGGRFYDSITGRFINNDPFNHENPPRDKDNPQSLNSYGYALNNPHKFVDPNGKFYFPWDILDYYFWAKSDQEFRENPTFWGGAEVVANALAALLPAVPSIGVMKEGLRIGEKAIEALASSKTVVEAGKVTEKSAFQIASEGGKHSGFLKTYMNKAQRELQSGIKSLKEQIAAHKEWIENPYKKVREFDKLDPRQQKALIMEKWPGDIKRQQEQLQILEELLKAK